MVNEDQLRMDMESLGIDSETIEQVLLGMKEKSKKTVAEEKGRDIDLENRLDIMISQERDWRKRAVLSAKKISLSL